MTRFCGSPKISEMVRRFRSNDEEIMRRHARNTAKSETLSAVFLVDLEIAENNHYTTQYEKQNPKGEIEPLKLGH